MISKAEWKCAFGDNGEQYVMTPGISEMQVLPADSLVSPQNVRGILTQQPPSRLFVVAVSKYI